MVIELQTKVVKLDSWLKELCHVYIRRRWTGAQGEMETLESS